jgi:hypothetical protein
MTSTTTDRPVGPPLAAPDTTNNGTDSMSRPADLTAEHLALAHRSGAGISLTAGDRHSAIAQNGPVLHPPGTAGAATTQLNLAGTWQTKQILALYNTRAARNGWAYLDSVGWRRFATTSDSAHTALGILASASRAAGSQVVARDEADGQLHEIYLW